MKRTALACLFVGLAAGCGISGPDEECQYGDGFIGMGCATIKGVVTDSSGMPLWRVSVGPRYLDGGWSGTTVFDYTDRRGRYRIKIVRTGFPGDPYREPPDTMTLFLRGWDMSTGATDSVGAVVSFGQDFPVTTVDLVLPPRIPPGG